MCPETHAFLTYMADLARAAHNLNHFAEQGEWDAAESWRLILSSKLRRYDEHDLAVYRAIRQGKERETVQLAGGKR